MAAALDGDINWFSGVGVARYLVDSDGRSLYVFANDTPSSGSSRCVDGCLSNWPAFDQPNPALGNNVSAADVARFQRADGAWQTTYKGRPLYDFANDTASNSTAGDGLNERWFLARTYNAMLSSSASVTPDGASNANDVFMTNGAGRTVYVFANDTPAGGVSPAQSACSGGCLTNWPIWPAPADISTLVVPSTMQVGDFEVLERDVNGTPSRQLTYRGWPLYYFAADTGPGQTSGHDVPNWSAINPTGFGGAVTSGGVGLGY